MVEAIWRYPLKSAQGESVAHVFFGSDGPEGDRSWACISTDGSVVSAKNPRRWGRLLHVGATLRPAGRGRVVTVHVPGWGPVQAGGAAADRILSAWLGEEVRLSDAVPAEARLHRSWPTEDGMIPDWVDGARAGGVQITDIGGALPGGRFVDAYPVHVVTTHELNQLSERGVDSDVRRFRPNLVLSLDTELSAGDVVDVGPDVTLRVAMPTPRCAVPGAAQPGLERAPEVLRAVGRHRVDIAGYGRAAVLGTYAEVLSTGTVTVGDRATARTQR